MDFGFRVTGLRLNSLLFFCLAAKGSEGFKIPYGNRVIPKLTSEIDRINYTAFTTRDFTLIDEVCSVPGSFLANAGIRQ